MRKIFAALCLLIITSVLNGCTLGAENGSAQPPGATSDGNAQALRVVTHESFSMSEALLAAFEAQHNAEVMVIPAGDAGAMVNQSILSANNPLGDVLFGVDNTFLTRALAADIFEPYEPDALAQVPDEFELDPEHRVVPIDFGDVCLNYDRGWFEENRIPVPTSLEELTRAEYKDLLIVENPASSSPGLAFLLTTVEQFGEAGWEAYWQQLRANGVLVTDGWSDAYYTHFSGGGGDGTRPLVVSYASSPAASGGATASVLGDGTCFRQIEFAGLLRNGNNPELARAWIDFMLTPEFQNEVASQMYVYPVLEGASVPPEFEQYAQVAPNPVVIDPVFIEERRDELIERWTRVVLR